MSLEQPHYTWMKRYQQRHYSYRDFHEATAIVTPTTYVFGTNARNPAAIVFPVSGATLNPLATLYNWPYAADGPQFGLGCFAREVKIVALDEDVWIRIISINPEYLEEAVEQAATAPAPTVPQFITEIEQVIAAGEQITFYPTFGISILFRRVSLDGTIRIYAEGNIEGTD